jgi:hypothetical protein
VAGGGEAVEHDGFYTPQLRIDYLRDSRRMFFGLALLTAGQVGWIGWRRGRGDGL